MSGSGTRHACDQRDQLETFSWTTYDPRQGGVQVLEDGPNNVVITTELLKLPGGDHGGSWVARIKGDPLNPGPSSFVAPVCQNGLMTQG